MTNSASMKRCARSVLLGAAVVVFLTGLFAPGVAGAVEKHVRVQLLSMMVPTVLANGRKGRDASMTAYFVVPSRKHASRLCSRSSMVRDSLFQALYEHPIPRRKNGGVIMVGYNELIKNAANKAVRSARVTEAHLAPGAATMGGGVIARLPFTSVSGCRQIFEGDRDFEKMRKN